jgi:hypothetical protein
MSDEKITDLNQKQPKNPKEAAINQLKEATTKEFQDKIKAQVKKTIDAGKIFKAEKTALENLLTDYEEEKASLSDVLKGI